MSNENTARLRRWAESVLAMPAGHHDEDVLAAAEHILATTDPLTMADVEWDDKHFLAGATINEGDSAKEMVMCGFTRDGEIYVVEPNPGRGKRGYWPMPGDLTPNGKKYELVEVTDKPENPVEPSTKTMDEYSPAECADMVGMWAGYNRHVAGGDPTAFVIITGEENEAGRVPCYNPGAPMPHAWAPDPWMLTPRFDMPRAWSTDGEPCAPTVSPGENVGNDQQEHPETLSTLEDYENAPVGTIVAKPGYSAWTKGRDGSWHRGGEWAPSGLMAGTERQVLRWGDGS